MQRAIAQVFGELGNRENRGIAGCAISSRSSARRASGTSSATAAGLRAPARRRGAHPALPGRPRRRARRAARRDAPTWAARYRSGASPARSSWRSPASPRSTATARSASPRTRTSCSPACRTIASERSPAERPSLPSLLPRPGPFERGVVACTGSEFCRFADRRDEGACRRVGRELDRAVRRRAWAGGAGLRRAAARRDRADALFRLPRLCGQPQIADIGFRGETAHVGDEIVEARRHRPRGQPRRRRRLRQLGGRCDAGRAGARRLGAGRGPLPRGAPSRRAVPRMGPAQRPRRSIQPSVAMRGAAHDDPVSSLVDDKRTAVRLREMNGISRRRARSGSGSWPPP